VSPATSALRPRIEGAEKTVSVCPYCAVGCSQLVFHRDNRILDIEGNPESPINGGTLCPKGAATYQLHVNPDRVTEVLYRAPYSDHWETRSLEWAMARTAQLIKDTRDAGWVDSDDDGIPVNHTAAIAATGGATLDNEENYLIKKLLGGGLGVISIENQARI
jgi:formate dehydrogenase major subunit